MSNDNISFNGTLETRILIEISKSKILLLPLCINCKNIEYFYKSDNDDHTIIVVKSGKSIVADIKYEELLEYMT